LRFAEGPFVKFRWPSLLLAIGALHAQTGDQVLLVVNQNDAISREIGDYYRPRRSVPVKNVCFLYSTSQEEISRDTYLRQVERPIAACLQSAGLAEKIIYIALTPGVPLKVDGPGGGMTAEHASVDSELALLYGKLHGTPSPPLRGGVPNPFFMKRSEPFRHSHFPIYLVARLAAFDVAETEAMIDRSLAARNRGKFVIDLSSGDPNGDGWLRTAALLLPASRVVIDETKRVLYDQQDVIGYAD
jgi:uncharacterized protein (TIGR03790 family)